MLITRPMRLIRADGTEQALCFSIDGPHSSPAGLPHLPKWRSFCRVRIGVLDEQPQEVYGLDDLHALAQSLACISASLRVLSTGGKLVFADGTPFDEQLYGPMLPVPDAAALINLLRGQSN